MCKTEENFNKQIGKDLDCIMAFYNSQISSNPKVRKMNNSLCNEARKGRLYRKFGIKVDISFC